MRSHFYRGTASGTTFRLRGRGVPHIERRSRGDMLIDVVVDLPTPLTEEPPALNCRIYYLSDGRVSPIPSREQLEEALA